MTNAAVYIDDQLPIQAALNAVGMVYLPTGGTFVIGSPGADDNAPLFIPSNSTLFVPPDTTVKLCDRCAQISQALISVEATIGSDWIGYLFPQACLIANEHNSFWHLQRPYPLDGGINDSLLTTPTKNAAVIGGGLLDGNWDNQVATSAGNRTGGGAPGTTGHDYLIPNQKASTSLAVVRIGSPVANGLRNGHRYTIVVNYADSHGRESAGVLSNVGPEWVIVPEDGNPYEIQLTHVTPPPNAATCIMYIIDKNDPNIKFGTGGWFWGVGTSQATDSTLMSWTRIDLGTVPPAGTVTRIQSYEPDEPHGGFGTFPPSAYYVSSLVGDVAGGNSAVVFLDNCDGFTLECNIQNGVQDGLLFSSAPPPRVPLPRVFAKNVITRNIRIQRCGREALGITGAVDTNLFDNLSIDHCPWVMDIEVDVYHAVGSPTDNITWRDCTFRGDAVNIFLLAIFLNSPARNLRFESCDFGPVGMAISGVGLLDLSLYDCSFHDVGDDPSVSPFGFGGGMISSRGGLINITASRCRFINCSRANPFYYGFTHDSRTGEFARGFVFLSNNGEFDPASRFTHMTVSDCYIHQSDSPNTGGQTLVNKMRGCQLYMTNNTIVTQTQSADLAISTPDSPSDYFLSDLVDVSGNPANTKIVPAP